MVSDIIAITAFNFAKVVGGFEIANLAMLLIMGAIANIARAGLPTYLFIFMILLGQMQEAMGGSYRFLYGVVVVIGALIFIASVRKQST